MSLNLLGPNVIGLMSAVCLSAIAWAAYGARKEWIRSMSRSRLAKSDSSAKATDFNGFRSKKIRRVAFLILAILIAAFAGLVPALLVIVFGFGIEKATSVLSATRRIRDYEQSVPLALDSIARSLRSGAGILSAIQEAGESNRGDLGNDMRRVVRETKMGNGIGEALDNWASLRPYYSVKLCSGALSLALETGAAQGQVIDSVAATLRQSLNAREMAKSAASEYQMTAVAMSALPIFIAGPLLATNADARSFMFHTPVGASMLLVGIALDVGSLVWMNSLIERSTR